MPTRTISITEEAYKRLSLLKDDHESFSQIIVKLTGKVNLLDFAGVLTDEEASTIEKRIKAGRAMSQKRVERIREAMGNAS